MTVVLGGDGQCPVFLVNEPDCCGLARAGFAGATGFAIGCDVGRGGGGGGVACCFALYHKTILVSPYTVSLLWCRSLLFGCGSIVKSLGTESRVRVAEGTRHAGGISICDENNKRGMTHVYPCFSFYASA